MNNELLLEYQKYLRAKSLVQEKYITYYAHWASKFLSFSNKNKELNHVLQTERFLDHLATQESIKEWQIRQAHDAIRLYFNHFKGSSAGNIQEKCSLSDIVGLIEKMRQAIRIRHYAYSTERTYIHWTNQFLNYTKEVKKEVVNSVILESEDVSNYLSYLALKKRVSASTQNQAFNSILFFFRFVLNKELSDLANVVRAKRGQRLPVVLSIEEIREMFKYVHGTNLLILQVLYGAGLRLMEAVNLRVKDIDFGSDLIFVRDGKGGKDRTTVMPETVKKPLELHLLEIRSLHEKDLVSGHGKVYLPNALERKYPNAAKEWHWQYVFPSSKLSADPRSGKIRRHHIHKTTVQSALKRQ